MIHTVLHLPHTGEKPNLFVLSIGGIVCFSIMLFTFVVSYMGGDGFVDSLGGTTTLVVLVAGLVLSVIASIITIPDEGLQSL